MNKPAVYRFTALLILVAVLFVQLGVNLLHNHQGTPPANPSALHSDDNSAANCNACAIDGMPVLYAEENPAFCFTSFLVSPSTLLFIGRVTPVSVSDSGRAPPIC